MRTSSHPSHSSHLPQRDLSWWCSGFLFVCLVLWFFGSFAWLFLLVCLGFVSCFPLLLACLSSFTDWCTAHRQQFREQKKTSTLQWKACVVTIELTPRGKKSEVRSSASSVVLWFVSSALFGVFLPRVVLAGYLDFMMRGTCGFPTQWL